MDGMATTERAAPLARDFPEEGAVQAILGARHGDPFALLGPHPVQGGTAIRAFLPGATSVEAVERATGLPLGALVPIDPAGFWSGIVPRAVPYRLLIDGAPAEDPYRFPPVLGELDIHLLREGRHHDISAALGAHPATIEGVAGTRFAVWAPNARRVSVVGSFNAWDGRRHPMRLRQDAGVWELFLPDIGPGALYKYEILGADGAVTLKADPFAQQAEAPPATASIVADPAPFAWTDSAWLDGRPARQRPDAPIAIYELHAMSWMPGSGLSHPGHADWESLADRLVPYLGALGFTHVELMPIMEHPFGGSWGYQPLGQFAPTARLGPPRGFAAFVDRCHAAGIGVILDWVPAHFPTDAHGLARFDGTALYEHADPREGFHQDWNTLIYNHGRNEVRNFLIGSALFWLEHYHVDGLRVDAVASMLYRDYSRRDGEWIPNRYGGRENLEAIDFFRELSATIAERVPGAVLIAEESTAFPNVSRPPEAGGLGFHYKWNMGWMHDTLHYMAENPIHRRWHHDSMTFGLIYAFSENFVLPLSHDEVVYGKGSMIRKMPGDTWQRFANLRAYYGFMWTQPGKKLLFMGGEFAQDREWNHDEGLDWFLLDQPAHRGVQSLIADLNALYVAEPALHARDASPDGFRWVVADDRENSVFAWLRLGPEGSAPILAISNFTPVPRHGYRLGVPQGGAWIERLNTDASVYGGSGVGNGGRVEAEPTPSHGFGHALRLTIPPLATLVLRPA
jgi:1,4-alpha-glucan branching enzyme